MEKWEYWTGFLWANIEDEGVREFMKKRWPNWKNPPKYAPQTMIPALNNFGEAGWELVHMEPVPGVVGVNYDMAFFGRQDWSNAYFCVFKRRKQE